MTIENKYYISELQKLKENIEKLDISEQIGLLRNLKDNIPNLESLISENQNGIFINLSSMNTTFIQHLKEYLKYVTTQREHLDSLENEKDMLKKIFNSAKSNNMSNINNEIIKL